MAKKAIAVEVLTMTPQLAEEFLKKNLGNRNLDERLALHYGEKMESGLWVPGVAEVSFDEKGSLINGQHVCTACMLSGSSITVRVTHNMDSRAFAVYDTGKRRTGNQTLKLAGFQLGTNGDSFMKLYYLWKHYPGDSPMEGFNTLRHQGRSSIKGAKFSNELAIKMASELESEEIAEVLRSIPWTLGIRKRLPDKGSAFRSGEFRISENVRKAASVLDRLERFLFSRKAEEYPETETGERKDHGKASGSGGIVKQSL